MVTVLVEETPGGVLVVSSMEEDRDPTEMYFPVGIPVEVPKGTRITVYDEGDKYDDNSGTFLLNYIINGEQIRYDELMSNEFDVNEDTTFSAEFVRIPYEENPFPSWPVDPEQQEEADPDKLQYPYFVNDSGKYIRTLYPDSDSVEVQLYDKKSYRNYRTANGDFKFGAVRAGDITEYITRYSKDKPEGEKLYFDEETELYGKKISAGIDSNGLFRVDELEDGYRYVFDILQTYKRSGDKEITARVNRLQLDRSVRIHAEYPIAVLESGIVSASGGSYYFSDGEKVRDVLTADVNPMLGITPSGNWIDEDGEDITDEPAGSRLNANRQAYAYAKYTDYKPQAIA
ncbi:MAG: hypothetical protein Q4C63_07535 [Eubacteriales bacterium]|nr:hypothetical protein [Eubacteriales bacterium]